MFEEGCARDFDRMSLQARADQQPIRPTALRAGAGKGRAEIPIGSPFEERRDREVVVSRIARDAYDPTAPATLAKKVSHRWAEIGAHRQATLRVPGERCVLAKD